MEVKVTSEKIFFYEIWNITVSANNIFQCEDILDWHPDQTVKSHSLCVCCDPSSSSSAGPSVSLFISHWNILSASFDFLHYGFWNPSTSARAGACSVPRCKTVAPPHVYEARWLQLQVAVMSTWRSGWHAVGSPLSYTGMSVLAH